MYLRHRPAIRRGHALLLRLVPRGAQSLPWWLAAAAAGLLALHPVPPGSLWRLIDWDTLGALAGLLLLTKGVECSGALQAAARRMLLRITDLRRLALCLTALAAALSALLTNDVCLFLLVPLTRALAAQARLPLALLVALEAVAVNAGSASTPIGNPQNLFLWQRSGIGFGAFVATMAPVVAIMLALLAGTVCWLVPRGAIRLRDGAAQPSDRPLLWIAGGLFPPFLAAVDCHRLLPALLVLAVIFLARQRRVLRQVDWSLLVIIGLMFVDMRLLGSLPAVAAGLQHLRIDGGLRGYLAAVAASQVLSNVPAAILLAPYIHDLPALLAGVNVGGFGCVVGSLANLIALRLSGAPGGLAALHRVSVPFLLVCAALVALLQLR